MNNAQEHPIFKLFEDFLTAEKILKSFENKIPNKTFEEKIRASFQLISDSLDIELHKCADSAPEFTEPGSTTQTPL